MRHCQICGKIAGRGNHKVERGKAKYLGGNGRKTTGITKRHYHVNLQNVRIQTPFGASQARVCTKCIRAGRIQKAVVKNPFSLSAAATPTATTAN
jgi:large subunit ribosomal protein L28